MRVPCIMRWPGRIEAGQECDEVATAMDFLPTFANLAGGKVPTDRIIDGKDPLPVLTGKTRVSPHETFFFQFEEHAALRWGDWKIVRTKFNQPWQLFNLKDDISEAKNKALERPDLVEKLYSAFILKREEIQRSHSFEAE